MNHTDSRHHLRALLRSARQRARNRSLASGSARHLVYLAAVVSAGGLGWLLLPDALGPVNQGRGVIHWGGWTLETSFYLACGIAVLQSFRILEGFFRGRSARVLATRPVHLGAVFQFQLGARLLETFGLCGLVALFLLPAAIKGHVASYAAALALLLLGAWLVVITGFACLIAAGTADYSRVSGSGGSADAGGIYLYSPAVATGMSFGLLLLVKMTLDEVLKRHFQEVHFSVPNIAWFMLGALLISSLAALVWTSRTFQRHYSRLFSRFFEADIRQIDAGVDYFAGDRKPSRGLEARLDGALRIVYRANRLQVSRRFPLVRFAPILGIVVALVTYLALFDRLTAWQVAALVQGWLLLAIAPALKAHSPTIETGQGRLLPVAQRDVFVAHTLVG
ncbi:MAG: hypothetical protein KC561_19535, partial [Myxococcales bacterium]|nr:hypothetical protein [Myxococcales bacterium]